MLRIFGVGEINSADSGPEALRLLSGEITDAVLVDRALPEMWGIDMARRIRRGDASINPYVPLIMVTGHADQRRIAKVRNAGLHEFAVKPVSPSSLAKHLFEVAEKPRPFVMAPTYFGPDRRRRVVRRQPSDRCARAAKLISTEEIASYVARLHEKVAEGPVERMKIPADLPAIAFKSKTNAATP